MARFFGVVKGYCPYCKNSSLFSYVIGFTGICGNCNKTVSYIFGDTYAMDIETVNGTAVDTLLKTKATAALVEEVEEELKTPDPPEEQAKAALKPKGEEKDAT